MSNPSQFQIRQRVLTLAAQNRVADQRRVPSRDRQGAEFGEFCNWLVIRPRFCEAWRGELRLQ